MHFQWQMKTDGEVVYTMTDSYDGPAEGIADYEGRPHAYLRRFDDLSAFHEDGDLFELWPVDGETYRLALEEGARHEQRDAVLKARLAPPAEGRVLARGQFRRRERPGEAREGMGLKVWWTPVGSPGRPAPSPWPSPEGRGNAAHWG